MRSRWLVLVVCTVLAAVLVPFQCNSNQSVLGLFAVFGLPAFGIALASRNRPVFLLLLAIAYITLMFIANLQQAPGAAIKNYLGLAALIALIAAVIVQMAVDARNRIARKQQIIRNRDA